MCACSRLPLPRTTVGYLGSLGKEECEYDYTSMAQAHHLPANDGTPLDAGTNAVNFEAQLARTQRASLNGTCTSSRKGLEQQQAPWAE